MKTSKPIQYYLLSNWRRHFRRRYQDVGIRLSIIPKQEEPDELVLELVVDGRLLTSFDHGSLDLQQLERSLQGDGTFFIWTCECGEPGCAGRFNGVAVHHRGERVNWHDRDMKAKYSFHGEHLRQSLAHALSEGHRLLSERPELDVSPDRTRAYLKTCHPA